MIDTEYSNLVAQFAPNGSNINLNEKTIGEKIYDWSFAGIPIMLALATLLQYMFEISNQSALVGMFAPVNESISEILKQAFWAMVIFSAIEYAFIKNLVNNYLIAKLSGLILLLITISLVHYILNYFFGNSNIILFAIPFVAGAILGQTITFSVFHKPVYALMFTRISVALIIYIAVSLEVSTIDVKKTHMLSFSNNQISENIISK